MTAFPEPWCKSKNVPITEGFYYSLSGEVEVVRSTSGRFYAKRFGKYEPGLIYRLQNELEHNLEWQKRSSHRLLGTSQGN